MRPGLSHFGTNSVAQKRQVFIKTIKPHFNGTCQLDNTPFIWFNKIVMPIKEAIEELEYLLSAYRWKCFNLTDDGWERIDADTQKYDDALSAIRKALEKEEEKPASVEA